MATSEYPADPPADGDTWSDIVVGCFNEREAGRLAALLRGHHVIVTRVDGPNVHVPWGGNPRFLFGVLQLAVARGHASDVVAAAAQHTRIREIERRFRWT